jgi:hypothetical protein
MRNGIIELLGYIVYFAWCFIRLLMWIAPMPPAMVVFERWCFIYIFIVCGAASTYPDLRGLTKFMCYAMAFLCHVSNPAFPIPYQIFLWSFFVLFLLLDVLPALLCLFTEGRIDIKGKIDKAFRSYRAVTGFGF